jgi:hypothetical protein
VVWFYYALFTKNAPLSLDEENLVLGCISYLVLEEMNRSLLMIISLEDLENIVFQMKKGKAPKPNGFPIGCFQEFWDTI